MYRLIVCREIHWRFSELKSGILGEVAKIEQHLSSVQV